MLLDIYVPYLVGYTLIAKQIINNLLTAPEVLGGPQVRLAISKTTLTLSLRTNK